MSEPVKGWDQAAQDYWDALSSKGKADYLRMFVAEVVDRSGGGNTSAHMLAAANSIERLGKAANVLLTEKVAWAFGQWFVGAGEGPAYEKAVAAIVEATGKPWNPEAIAQEKIASANKGANT